MAVFEWIQNNETLLMWLGIASVAVLGVSVVLLPWLLISLPADHFLRDRSGEMPSSRSPVLRWTYLVTRNILGVVLLLAGVAMLALPGQGLLAMFAGLMLINFPGKHRIERRIVSHPRVRRAIDRLRCRAGRPPLLLDDSDDRRTQGDRQ